MRGEVSIWSDTGRTTSVQVNKWLGKGGVKQTVLRPAHSVIPYANQPGENKMKYLIILIALLFTVPTLYAGEEVDRDGDGFHCVVEDDGTYCNEDGQDRCDGIPNISLDDDHCSVDRNDDGLFTLADFRVILVQNDHFLTGVPYPNHEALGVPINFGGYVCFDIMRVIEYNRRLEAAGLPLLQRDQPFLIAGIPSHCSKVHHSYPEIE